jgi:hypothetical protein
MVRGQRYLKMVWSMLRKSYCKFLLSVLLLLLCLGGYGWSFGVRITTTHHQQERFVQEFFKKHLHALFRDGEGIRMVTDGQITLRGEASFYLKQLDVFEGPLDKHSKMKFELEEIQEDGVTIGYESRVDHHSFGKNLIAIDQGILKLEWQNE